MPRYKWKIEFEAENDADADEQVEEAIQAFHAIHEDELDVVEPA